jgi:hypothetical protein
MSKEIFKETEVMICECYSMEHQVKFYYMKGEHYDLFSIIVHLTTHKNIFKRIWYATKYVLGYTSRYGAWDELHFKPEDREKLKQFLNELQ